MSDGGLSREEFQVLRKSVSGFCEGSDRQTLMRLYEYGYINGGNRITDSGMEALVPYKVDNAVILAAGMAKRFLPLSAYMPKGLFQVKGEVLIERQIRQLQETGITEIVIVTGYQEDKFEYLADTYGIKLISNPEYETANNISSVWYARSYLKNTYILGSDNWYGSNIFEKYEYEPYYSRVFSRDYVDEYCIDMNEGYIEKIRKGGRNTWYTLGEIYFDRRLSAMVLEDLQKEYQADDAVRAMIIDLYCMRHIDRYRFYTKEREKGVISEFDTMEELMEFDPRFGRFASEVMKRKGEDKK